MHWDGRCCPFPICDREGLACCGPSRCSLLVPFPHPPPTTTHPPSAPNSAAASEDVVLKIETPIGQDVESEEDDPPIDPFEDLGECVRCCPRVWRAGESCGESLAIVPWPGCAVFVGTDTTTTAATIPSFPTRDISSRKRPQTHSNPHPPLPTDLMGTCCHTGAAGRHTHRHPRVLLRAGLRVLGGWAPCPSPDPAPHTAFPTVLALAPAATTTTTMTTSWATLP